MSLVRICKADGCYCKTSDKSGYCERHLWMERADQEKKRQGFFRGAPSSSLYNSSRWRKASKEYLKSNPVCAKCGQPATEVHHVIPHRGDESVFWAESNWQGLCHMCHVEETKREARGRNQKLDPRRRKLWY